MNYKILNDSDLLQQTQKLVSEERRITLEVLHALREIEARALYARESYSSLFEFCVRRLGYSESQSVRRISAMRLLKAVPEVESKVATGELKVSQLAQVQTLIRTERKEMGRVVSKEETLQLLAQVSGRSSRETEKVILNHSPALRQKRQTEERVRPLTESHSEIKLVADEELMKLLEEAKALVAYNGEMNPSVAELMKRGLKLLIADRRKKRNGNAQPIATQKEGASFMNDCDALPHATSKVSQPTVRSAPNSTQSPSTSENRSRFIPIALKRAVFTRTNSRCEFLSPDGRRCDSTHALELHHVMPYARGGEHSMQNLRAYCRGHNAAQGLWDFAKRSGYASSEKRANA